MTAQHALASGRYCALLRSRHELIRHYYILAFPLSQGQPDADEVREMLTLGVQEAERLSHEHTGDPHAYTILYSGYSARREKGWHIHIVLLGNRWRKAWMYFVLCGKNLLQALGLRRDNAPRAPR